MTRSRACRHCHSPAKGNPCWYYVERPDLASGGDPPCYDELYDFDERDRWKAARRQRIGGRLALGALVVALVIFGLRYYFAG